MNLIVLVIIAVLALVVGGLVYSMSMRTVGAGEVGIVTEWASPIKFVGEGLQLVNPISQSLIIMDVKTQKLEQETTAASKDLQNVLATIAVNYKVNQDKALNIYKTIGLDYGNRVIIPNIQEIVKQVTANYQAAQLILERDNVKNQIMTLLHNKLIQYGIDVNGVSITNFKFSDQFEQAIEKTAEAQQQQQRATNELKVTQIQAQKAIVEANANKNASITNAQGLAESNQIKAAGEAKAIEQITKSVNDNPSYIDYLKVTKWNGILPMFGGDKDTSIILPPNIIPQTNVTNATHG